MPVKRGTWPAVTAAEVIGAHRLRLYRLYDREPKVVAWIDDLYSRLWSELAATMRRFPEYLPDSPAAIAAAETGPAGLQVDEYLKALRWEAWQFGLDRIPRVGPAPERRRVAASYQRSGIAQVHALLWYLDKHLLREATSDPALPTSGDAVPRPTFTAMASFGGPVPSIDLRVGSTGETWDPRLETFADARRRIRRSSGSLIDVIEQGLQAIVVAGGYRLPDTRTSVGGRDRLDRAATWTFLRLRHRWSYREIAERWNERHPTDLQLRPLDDVAGDWDAEHRDDAYLDDGHPVTPVPSLDLPRASDQVRKAVGEFALNADVDVSTPPGRRSPAQ